MAKNALEITRAQNFPDWYQEVIKAADLAENSNVRGCMVIKPWGYAIWERMRDLLDRRIKETGHDNCYFPLFIPLSLFKKEAEHVEGFAKEMAIITHTRLENKDGTLGLAGELDEPLVVRPTSETIIGESFAKWIGSYRDLPVKINQWANVVRWEMRPRIFLRTTEFLWQEGHTAHANRKEAEEEVFTMLEAYRELLEDRMRIPVITGKKSPSERFAGAEDTYTLEAMMQDGKALQAGTSHYLGQHFAKSAGIMFQDENNQQQLAHTTSWGVSTRMMGALIMTHSDDDGLRLPPQVAPQQIYILPILKDDENDAKVIAACDELKTELQKRTFADEPVRVRVLDKKGNSGKWDLVRKGVPLLVEIGPRDLEQGTVAIMRRDDIQGKKIFMPKDQFVAEVAKLLKDYEDKLYADAVAYREAKTVTNLKNFEEFKEYFKKNETGFVRAKWCEDPETEALLDEVGIKIRCVPFKQTGTTGTCILTGRPATADAIFAKAY